MPNLGNYMIWGWMRCRFSCVPVLDIVLEVLQHSVLDTSCRPESWARLHGPAQLRHFISLCAKKMGWADLKWGLIYKASQAYRAVAIGAESKPRFNEPRRIQVHLDIMNLPLYGSENPQ